MGHGIEHEPTDRCLRCGSRAVDSSRRTVVLYDRMTTDEARDEAERRAFHSLLTWGDPSYSDREEKYAGNLCEECFRDVADFIRGR